MARLSQQDERTVSALVEETRLFRPGRDGFWRTFLPKLSQTLRARVSLAVGLRRTAPRPHVAFAEILNAPVEAGKLRADFEERLQRLPPAAPPVDALQAPGLERHERLHLVVCESDSLFVWVGVYRPPGEPFAAREQHILRRLKPALSARLSIEEQLAHAPLARAALDVCLNALVRPALIIDAQGRPQFSNAPARRALESNRQATAETLRACLHGRSTAFTLTPLVCPGQPTHWLAIESAKPREAAPLLPSARARWGLTARELEALALLTEGLSNRAIAASLSCAERTVEVHVARLLAKTHSESRSQLIARFWSDGHLEEERNTHVRP